jgi:hypothetical protein
LARCAALFSTGEHAARHGWRVVIVIVIVIVIVMLGMIV